MTHVLYYVSGHGYGHATRAAEVMRALTLAQPTWTVTVRTTAPTEFFTGAVGPRVAVENVDLDPGVVEEDNSLRVDPRRSVQALVSFMKERDRLVAAEVDYVRKANVSLIVADIPFLAGDVAQAAAVPCIGISNFTWAWIYEPFLQPDREFVGLLAHITAGYAKMDVFLRLPFAHPIASGQFREVRDVPLVARRSRCAPTDILAQLSVAPGDLRPRVFAAMRGGLTRDALDRVAADNPEILFLAQASSTQRPLENIRLVTLGANLNFADVLSVSSVVVSKLGYSIVAECLANGTALLWPPRLGFREDEILMREAPKFLRTLPLALSDFDSGHWTTSLRTLLTLPQPTKTMLVNGAEVCAAMIIERVTKALR